MAVALTARGRHALGGTPLALGHLPSRLAGRLRRWYAAAWRRLAADRVLPAGLRARLGFERSERALAVGRGPDGLCALVATDRAVYYGAGRDDWSRLGWEQVTRVSWDTATGHLVITGLAGGGAGTRVPLRDQGSWPELAQERITHTRLGSRHTLHVGLHRVLAEARRRPVTGELLWILTCHDPRLDLGVPETRRQVERAVARLGEDLGLTQTCTEHQLAAAIHPVYRPLG
jgi:hypothetical protein